MSNFLAPAMVTETLRHMLSDAATRAVPGAEITLGRPQTQTNGSSGPTVNIFLYLVSPNSAWANADLPTRGSMGALTRRPQIGVNLDYLFSFQGPESDLIPERLMGSCISRLHAQSILTPRVIEQAVGPLLDADPEHFLGNADLADQVDQVKLTPLAHNLEELSKLWSVFFQVPYVLSVAYQASVALIEEPINPAPPALPVRERRFVVQPFQRMQITRVESSVGPDAPIHADSTIRILGSELGGGNIEVNIGRETVASTSRTTGEITVDLTALTNLQAGILALCVVQHVSETAPHLRVESNVVPLTVSPGIPSVGFTPAIADILDTDLDESVAATIDLELIPPVVIGQHIRLFLNQLLETDALPDAEPLAYVIDTDLEELLDTEAPDEATAELAIPVSHVEPGTYLVRVQVDGAESTLEVDTEENSETLGRYIGPTVVVT